MLVGMVIAAVVFSPAVASAALPAGLCSWNQVQAGMCSSDGNGVTVELFSTTTTSEEPGSDATSPSDSSAPTHSWGSESALAPDPVLALYQSCAAAVAPLPDECRTLRPVGVMVGGTPGTPATPSRSITVTDLARFVPTQATFSAEPQNVAVVGLPANFVSTARTETVPGTVLGRALTIRFTPVSFLFDYGDGERRESATPGTPWDAAGQPQFTPTDTSHVYKAPGTFTATVTVTYSAEIDLGSGWQSITGTLTGPPAGQDIRVVKARTALVQGTCAERPTAPGC